MEAIHGEGAMIHWNQLSVQVDEDDRLIVDGVTLPVDVIPELLYSLAHPDSRKWYRFERIGDEVKVHIKIQEVPQWKH